MRDERLRVVVALDLPEDQCRRVAELEPRCDVIADHSLYRPMRWTADWDGDPELQRTPEQQQRLEQLLDSADALFGVPDVDPVALARTVAANPALRWVHTTAAGGGGQVRAAGLTPADLDRVAFTTSAGVHGGPLAEFALLGLLAGAKRLPALQDLQSRREWPPRFTMGQLEEMTVLVIGLGGIGAALATRLHALGCTVWGTSRTGTPVAGVDRVIPLEELGDALGRVDAVVVTVPGTARTERMLDDRMLSRLRPGTILVNVGRGTVIDEEALLRALDDGRVGYAALDVFAVEPLPPQSPLWEHPHVLVSPHTAALNDAEAARIVELFADNAGRLLDGRPLRNLVDTVEFY